MATPKKRNPQDATRGQVKQSDDTIRQDVDDLVEAVRSLSAKVAALESAPSPADSRIEKVVEAKLQALGLKAQ